MLADLWARRLDGRLQPEAGVGLGRLGASIVPPEDVAAHLDACLKFAEDSGRSADPDIVRRSDFLRSVVLPGGLGVVEGQAFGLVGGGPDLGLEVVSRVRPDEEPGAAEGETIDVDELFRRRVARALGDGSSVNMNNQNHVAISRVIAEFLLSGPDAPPGEIRVVYADGSEASPFPLRCLRPADPNASERVLPVGLMSMRHLLLDESVVVNWLRAC